MKKIKISDDIIKTDDEEEMEKETPPTVRIETGFRCVCCGGIFSMSQRRGIGAVGGVCYDCAVRLSSRLVTR